MHKSVAVLGIINGQPKKRRLMDRVRDQLRKLHYSLRTEEAYTYWIRQYILYHGKRHPADRKHKDTFANGQLSIDLQITTGLA